MAGTGETSVRSYNFHLDSTLQGGGGYADNQYPFVDDDSGLPFTSKVVEIANDSANPMTFRFGPPYTILAHGGITGPRPGADFVVGEPVVGQTSGATGTVSRVGDGFIHVVDVVGGPFVNPELLRGSKSRAEATTNAAPAPAPPHGTVGAGLTVTQDFRREKEIYLSGTATDAFRVTAY